MSKRYLFFAYYLPVFAWMGLIFWLSSIPNLELQGGLAVYDLVLRKLAHVAEYAVLSTLIYRALYFSGSLPKIPLTKPKKVLFLALILSVLYAISDEVHQYLVPTRDGKVVDVLIDSAGILLGVWLHRLRHVIERVLL